MDSKEQVLKQIAIGKEKALAANAKQVKVKELIKKDDYPNDIVDYLKAMLIVFSNST